ncbi:gab-1 [Symbiodinium natans]|uniref:Gab-1 protein n=1 Tax=Symbiodinium natans TaxID=878477 RepID=A0A812MQ65_9DINO|nr:gab-1 [Symbiodinium natans]
MLQKYVRSCDRNPETVDCKNAIKVIVEINPHELRDVDDKKDEFSVVFVLRFRWLDPNLKNIETILKLKDGRELKGRIQRLDQTGKITFITEVGETKSLKREDCSAIEHERNPDWSKQFFPDFSFLNVRFTNEYPITIFERYQMEWSDAEQGSFLRWEKKYDAIFTDDLDLRRYPIDRQLCRIRITAERPVEEYQFAMSSHRLVGVRRTCESFKVDQDIQRRCTSYVRWADAEIPFKTQRSRIHVLFHLERRGGHFFKIVVPNMMFVTLMAFLAFVLPIENADGSLALTSACFLAVFAQRYIISDDLPRKTFLTLADTYFLATSLLYVMISISIAVLVLARNLGDENPENAGLAERINRKKSLCGLALFLLAIIFNIWLIGKWLRKWGLEGWAAIYLAKQEPYAMIDECQRCLSKWPGKQCLPHEIGICKVCRHESVVTRHFKTPEDMDELVPSVRQLPIP